MENPAAALAPTSAPAAPAPAPVATPASAPAPAPVPAAPAPTAPVDNAGEDDGWDEVISSRYPGVTSNNKEDNAGEQAQPKEANEEATAPKANPGVEEQGAKPGEGNDDASATGDAKAATPGDGETEAGEAKDGAAEAAPANPRLAAKEAAQQLETVKTQVRDTLYPDTPDTLQDADGDPIESIEDVMRLIDPRTGEQFANEEAAAAWLLDAQQKFNKSLAERDSRVEQVAETHLDIIDQADSLKAKYGKLLETRTDLRDRLWTAYEKTLIKDPATGIIVGAPVSMVDLYEPALEPYRELAEQMEADVAAKAADAKAAADAEAEAQAAKLKREQAEQKKKNLADRSDIYAPNTETGPQDEDDAEWDAAHKARYGNVK